MSDPPKEKTEEEILERITTLYSQLEDLRERRTQDAAGSAEKHEGPRVILVTRRLPRDAPIGPARRKRIPDTMDQALSNFRQVSRCGRTVIWVGSPINAQVSVGEQREIRDRLMRECAYSPVFLDVKRERLFYDGFCKRVLWPLFHSSPPTTEDTVMRSRQPPVAGRCLYPDETWGDDGEAQLWGAYVGTNQAFADAVRDVALDGDLIWIQDYHFMLVPQMLRSLNHQAKLGFFLHVPFPSSELYRTLPFREEILHGLLAADLLGFQTYDYARHFLSSCEMVLGRAGHG